MDFATDKANTNPAHTACTSKETASTPIFFWTRVAVAGKVLSGVVVATIIKSISYFLIWEFLNLFLSLKIFSLSSSVKVMFLKLSL